jgi:hypothetical protein
VKPSFNRQSIFWVPVIWLAAACLFQLFPGGSHPLLNESDGYDFIQKGERYDQNLISIPLNRVYNQPPTIKERSGDDQNR